VWVFSFWTSSLDMVERGLIADNIGFVRVDGSVATKSRQQAIAKFRNDPGIQVILLTISCGARG
jgi:SNF2 family DNA or RNA helicase